MAISVVCPGCKKRFQVSDQFAGQTGPCPQCKVPIKIPEKGPEVTIHAPEAFSTGGRSQSGELLTKPIARQKVQFSPLAVALVAASAVVGVLVAYFGRSLFQEMLLARIAGLVLISPPLVLAAYWFLRDDELEPYSGRSLHIRSAVCALAYMLLWAAYTYVANAGLLTEELWTWFFIAPPLLFVGTMAAHVSLDLDLGNAFFHYAFYLIVTVLLRWTAGMRWVWDLAATSPVG